MSTLTKIEILNEDGDTEVFEGHSGGDHVLCAWCDHPIAASEPRLEREGTLSERGVSVHLTHAGEMIAESVRIEQGEVA